jgi:hypothetical protein
MADIVSQPARTAMSHVEWGAVFAGAVVASALSFVMLTAGAAVGLSMVSPFSAESYGKLAASSAVFWFLFASIISFLVGGYIAGRMRRPLENASSDEVEFRDSVHGLLVWGVSIMIGGLLAFFAAATAAQPGASALKAGLSDRGAIIAPAVDSLLHATATSTTATAPATAAAPRTSETGNAPTASPSRAANVGTQSASETRDEISRTFTNAIASGQLTPANRQYLSQLISQRTGLAPPDAEKRVEEAYAESLQAIEKARKATVLAGLVTVTALLLGLAAAWYAAQQGGRHRDQNIPARFNLRSPSATRRNLTTP